MKICVMDLETVPDYNVWTRPEVAAVDLTKCEKCGEPIPEPAGSTFQPAPKCKAMKRGTCRPAKAPAEPKEVFPPRYAHRVVCAGLLSIADDGWALGAAVAPLPEDEPGLLSWLSETLGNYDRVVTWGGTRFDIPVLEMRCLHHGIPLPMGLSATSLDLHDLLAPRWRNDDKLNLDTITRLIGLPGKNGVDGSMVEAMAASGNFEAIATYCLHDVVQTGYLWLRTELLHNRMSRDEYQAACGKLRAQWEGRAGFESFKVGPKVELV